MRMLKLSLAAALLAAAASSAAAGNAVAGADKAKVCEACHGPAGAAPLPGNPVLAGQYADYLAEALRQYQDGRRTNPVMKGNAAPLSAEDIRDLAAYFAAQKSPLAVAPRK